MPADAFQECSEEIREKRPFKRCSEAEKGPESVRKSPSGAETVQKEQEEIDKSNRPETSKSLGDISLECDKNTVCSP